MPQITSIKRRYRFIDVVTDEQDELIRSLNLKVVKLELKAGKNNMALNYLEDEERETARQNLVSKTNHLEQYRRREYTSFDRFELSESLFNCNKVNKYCMKTDLKVELHNMD